MASPDSTAQLLKTLGQVAGIGGIAFGVLLLVFQGIIGIRRLFPQLTQPDAYKLLRLIVVICGVTVVLGVVVYGIGQYQQNRGTNDGSGDGSLPSPTPTPAATAPPRFAGTPRFKGTPTITPTATASPTITSNSTPTATPSPTLTPFAMPTATPSPITNVTSSLCTRQELSGLRCLDKMTEIAQDGWEGPRGKAIEYASRRRIKAEAVSDSGYFGGGSEERTVRAAAETALRKCRIYVAQYHATDGETCALFMLDDQKVGTWK